MGTRAKPSCLLSLLPRKIPPNCQTSKKQSAGVRTLTPSMPASVSSHTSVGKTLQVPGCGPKGRRQEDGGRRVGLLDISGRCSQAGTLANGGVASSGVQKVPVQSRGLWLLCFPRVV